jgi:hypothetical protein
MTALIKITAVKPLNCDKGLKMSNNSDYSLLKIRITAGFRQ